MARILSGSIPAMIAFLLWSVPLSAQTTIDFERGSNWLVGYVANAPQQFLGLGITAWLPSTGAWGLHLGGKLTFDSPAGDEFDSSLTPAQAIELGDQHFNDRSAWASVNVAAVRGITGELALYLGGGVSWETAYDQFLDPTGQRGELGRYWVEDEERSQIHPNLMAGAFFRIGHWIGVQFGAETAPAGVTTGVHLRIR